MQFPVRTVVALTLKNIEQDSGYIPPNKNKVNTQSKVMDSLKTDPNPTLSDGYWELADEIILYFKHLEKMPEYKVIQAKSDSAVYQACIDAANKIEVTPLIFTFAVQMPHYYGILKPVKERLLNTLNEEEATLHRPGEYMGKLNQPERFFVKLVRVGAHSVSGGGHQFEVRDRNNNLGFFYERADKMEKKFKLGDCFAMHATPSRHEKATTGENTTIFRMVDIVDNKGSSGPIDPSNDVTGKFVKAI